jgi:hypothetical protein
MTRTAAPHDVLVSIVNHHHVDLLPACLDSIGPAAPGLAVRVTVLDNASPDGSVDMIRRRYPAVELIAQGEPRGFAANQNSIIGPRLADARYVLLLNDDACLGEGALSAMTAFMDAHPAAGMAGARLVYPDGSPQSSYAAFPRALDLVVGLWGLGRLAPKAWRRKNVSILRRLGPLLPRMTRVYLENWSQTPDQPLLVDWVCGACLIVRAEAIRQIGLLDADSFFMYFEDMDWCLRAHLAGWRVAFVPNAVVRHHQQASRGPATERAFVESGIRYFVKHGMRFDAWLLGVNVGARAVLVLAWETVARLFRGAGSGSSGPAIAHHRELLRIVRSRGAAARGRAR